MTAAKESKKVRLLPVASNAALILLELIGTAISFSNGGARNLVYYTVLSNILALISSIAFLISYLRRGGKVSFVAQMMRYFATCCLTVTFLVVVTILVPMAAPYGNAASVLYKGPQIYHHILCPILSFVSFVFIEQGMKLDRQKLVAGAAPTLAYALVFIVLNYIKAVHGPYPFLYVHEQPWYMSVMWFLVINGIALGFSFLIGKLRNKFSDK
ncbi:MAG: hypothetical protein IJ561_08235 [Ruminococcus sp.]|nr:hypothetical protein [Ruminococcus sp.]